MKEDRKVSELGRLLDIIALSLDSPDCQTCAWIRTLAQQTMGQIERQDLREITHREIGHARDYVDQGPSGHC
jgi:hypothetical protein